MCCLCSLPCPLVGSQRHVVNDCQSLPGAAHAVQELGGSQVATWCQVTQPPCQVTACHLHQVRAKVSKAGQQINDVQVLLGAGACKKTCRRRCNSSQSFRRKVQPLKVYLQTPAVVLMMTSMLKQHVMGYQVCVGACWVRYHNTRNECTVCSVAGSTAANLNKASCPNIPTAW
jgi:hypothetical protein